MHRALQHDLLLLKVRKFGAFLLQRGHDLLQQLPDILKSGVRTSRPTSAAAGHLEIGVVTVRPLHRELVAVRVDYGHSLVAVPGGLASGGPAARASPCRTLAVVTIAGGIPLPGWRHLEDTRARGLNLHLGGGDEAAEILDDQSASARPEPRLSRLAHLHLIAADDGGRASGPLHLPRLGRRVARGDGGADRAEPHRHEHRIDARRAAKGSRAV